MCQRDPGPEIFPGSSELDGDSGHQRKKSEREWHLNDSSETTVQIPQGPHVPKHTSPCEFLICHRTPGLDKDDGS